MGGMNALPTLTGPRFGPQNGDTPDAIVLLLHGLGADGNDLIGLAPLFAEVAPGAIFISPDAHEPCDMAPMGRQWFSLRDFTDQACFEGAAAATPVLDAFIDGVLAEFGLDESRLVLSGFSQGCMMSLHVGLRRAKPLAGILGYSGMVTGPTVLGGEIASRPPVCLVHGEIDAVVPFASLGMAGAVLGEQGVSVETHARPGLGHGIDEEGIQIGRAFLKKVL